MKVDALNYVNELIRTEVKPDERGEVSDGYHSFNELYDHRIINFIIICKCLLWRLPSTPIWKSKAHADGTVYDGWFIMGIYPAPGQQISYHLPMKYWDMTKFARELTTAPEWDKHTPTDVLVRLTRLAEEL